jgi:hypothetical protein
MSLKGEEGINHSLTIVYSPFFFNNIFKIFFIPFLLLLNCLVVSYFSLKKVKITPSSSLVIGTTWKLGSFFFFFFSFFLKYAEKEKVQPKIGLKHTGGKGYDLFYCICCI